MSDFLKNYSYSYPEDLVAFYPAIQRDASRLLVLNQKTKKTEHRLFPDICDYFGPGDVLVLNDSKVFPCRLVTQRKTGGRQEIFLIRELEKKIWKVLVNANHKVHPGDRFLFEGLEVKILEGEGAERKALLSHDGNLFEILERIAKIPLPPYIHRETEEIDKSRYQTVYARDRGSVAAPTAGFHFTDDIFSKLKKKGVQIVTVTLHVGPGTFLPVRSEKISEHKMHEEFFNVSNESCDIINQAKRDGKKITTVGTTATRVLESVMHQYGELKPGFGSTHIFIYPPFEFKMIDQLITNFHQPESTLLMLVSAFAGREAVLAAYAEAIQKKYRLFSYGDAMILTGIPLGSRCQKAQD